MLSNVHVDHIDSDLLHPVSVFAHVSMQILCNLSVMMIPLLINLRMQTIKIIHIIERSQEIPIDQALKNVI